MEKRKLIIISAIVIILITIAFVVKEKIIYNYKNISKSEVSWLVVDGNNIKNENGENVLLKGISSHGLQWYSDILTEENFIYLKDEFNINVFRIAIYVNDETDFTNISETLYPIVDTLIELNLYVIVDWHILENGNPEVYESEAEKFFSEVSNHYFDTPNVIYEICNEPNGNNITWSQNIKPYAEKIIPKIRNNSPKSLIIVGSPDYCKKVNKPADDPLNYQNIVYSVHFYAGTHGQEVKDNIEYALNKGIAILATEWGTTDNTGDGNIYEEESKNWIEFLKEKNIGYINWSFCNKDEASAILSSKYKNKNINKYLTESGKLVRKLYK